MATGTDGVRREYRWSLAAVTVSWVLLVAAVVGSSVVCGGTGVWATGSAVVVLTVVHAVIRHSVRERYRTALLVVRLQERSRRQHHRT